MLHVLKNNLSINLDNKITIKQWNYIEDCMMNDEEKIYFDLIIPSDNNFNAEKIAYTKTFNTNLMSFKKIKSIILKKQKELLKKHQKEKRKVLINPNLCVKGTIRREGNNMMCKLNSDVDKLTKKLGNRKKALKQANRIVQSRFHKKINVILKRI